MTKKTKARTWPPLHLEATDQHATLSVAGIPYPLTPGELHELVSQAATIVTTQGPGDTPWMTTLNRPITGTITTPAGIMALTINPNSTTTIQLVKKLKPAHPTLWTRITHPTRVPRPTTAPSPDDKPNNTNSEANPTNHDTIHQLLATTLILPNLDTIDDPPPDLPSTPNMQSTPDNPAIIDYLTTAFILPDPDHIDDPHSPHPDNTHTIPDTPDVPSAVSVPDTPDVPDTSSPPDTHDMSNVPTQTVTHRTPTRLRVPRTRYQPGVSWTGLVSHTISILIALTLVTAGILTSITTTTHTPTPSTLPTHSRTPNIIIRPTWPSPEPAPTEPWHDPEDNTLHYPDDDPTQQPEPQPTQAPAPVPAPKPQPTQPATQAPPPAAATITSFTCTRNGTEATATVTITTGGQAGTLTLTVNGYPQTMTIPPDGKSSAAQFWGMPQQPLTCTATLTTGAGTDTTTRTTT